MKAIKVIEPFKVEIVDVPKPEIENPDDVIVRITSGGICGSDIGIWNGTNSLATYPRLISWTAFTRPTPKRTRRP